MKESRFVDRAFQQLHACSSRLRVQQQAEAVNLLLERYSTAENPPTAEPHSSQLRTLLSDATVIFSPNPVQEEIYCSDSGTAFVPNRLKKMLLSLSAGFIVRPGTLDDLQKFVAWAAENRVRYTIRGAGTWPFGGSVAMNREVVLDLSHLDFYQLYPEENKLAVAAGTLFATVRKALKQEGFALRQEITNPHSGSICGWVVTGGIGLGAYKYGHVRESVEAMLFLLPDGTWQTITPEDPLFERVFGSEGQIGILAGVILRVRPQNHITKPYAFSFSDVHGAQKFMQLLSEWKLTPTTVLYFDADYVRTTQQVEQEKVRRRLDNALELQDEEKIRELREELELIRSMEEIEHLVVLEFDAHKDYERCLKYPIFTATGERRRYRSISFQRLPVAMAHKLWEHRYLPVEMKPKGPSMLVSETILPVKKFPMYMEFVNAAVSAWTGNRVKTEAHLLNDREILIQSILLADSRRKRHQLYLGLVPFMTEAAVYFGGRTYGTGIWNLPFLKQVQKKGKGNYVQELRAEKSRLDPNNLINQCKFINQAGRKLALRLFKGIAPHFFRTAMVLLHYGRRKGKRSRSPFYHLGRLLWHASKVTLPLIVPPELRARRKPILAITSACAECDSCERVCPTSDVFGSWGIATPITRRKTANRIAQGVEISRAEALGFLACTRCDNCSRICPTNIPLTELFDLVEKDNRFQQALGMDEREKSEYIDRFWQIMKESPLYLPHTQAQQKEQRSHLEHGLKIIYPKGYAYARLYIDPETCIRCGMCAHENACTYGARIGHPREIPELLHRNCALCNACINFCPQNKAIQSERELVKKLIDNAVDLDEKKYWNSRLHHLRDTTTIQRTGELTEMADIYVTEDIIMEIDKEASTGQIPVSGMGQGDKHRGIGFDAERFSHFHIVGPAQNRLHEGDPDEELSVTLGKRHRYCTFDAEGHMHNPPYPKIKLKTPILYNTVTLDSNGRVELAFMKVAEQQDTLVCIKLNRLLEYYDFFKEEGGYEHLPQVIIPRVDHELIHHLIVNPQTGRDFLQDLWRMPMFALTWHPDIARTIQYINDSVTALQGKKPLLCGYLEVTEYDMVGMIELLPEVLRKIEAFLDAGMDVLHVHGKRNKDNYFVTSSAVRAVHHYLLKTGRRHEVAIIASGGIRLASDSQKTIQRGAEATLIDFAALLALDPYAYKAAAHDQTTTERLLNLDIEWAVSRLVNQMESRKVQILEVLGASGFKDVKKTVGEEGRLIDFNELELRIQKDIFEREEIIPAFKHLNEQLIAETDAGLLQAPKYSELKERVVPLSVPHWFYQLSETNQTVYQRDHVWPGWVIETMGRMAAGDLQMAYLKTVTGTGLLGDGFDVMRILYQRDPDNIAEDELDSINTAVMLDKGLILNAPWMFGGKSVGSIGLDTWRAHVLAVKRLGIQYDTGEGGYPTCFFLNRKGEPIFFTEPDMQEIKSYFEHGRHYTVREIRETISQNGFSAESHPRMFRALEPYPELQPFLFYVVIDSEHEPFISTELKTGLFGVTRETIKKARRVVIAYSQGAKMGIGGHILAQKVNKLVAYLRGVEGLEELNLEVIQSLAERIERLEKQADHPLHEVAEKFYEDIIKSQDSGTILPELKTALWHIQQHAYALHSENALDPIEFENLMQLCEDVISHSYSSIISPFPFHNCYSIEDVKSFIDMVRMINPRAVVSVKVSPSVDIEFIAAGLARISRDITLEALQARERLSAGTGDSALESAEEYAKKYGLKIEIWLDGPRGGTGASPNIIKGQMGMHIEYAIPLIHHRLVKDGLRNHVNFFVSGGIRTYEDVIKAVALGADGVIWGTAPLVAIGCDRNRNCHDGCSRGIATSNLIMQNLRDVEKNAQQITNAFLILQMQIIRALAGLGLRDIRRLRGRFDKIQWLGLKERVDFRRRQIREYRERYSEIADKLHPTGQSNCGVAAVIGTEPVPSYILDRALFAMKNRGMDGVGVGKTLCFPDYPEHYAYSIMVRGLLQNEVEEMLATSNGRDVRRHAREKLLAYRNRLAEAIRTVFLEPVFDFTGETSAEKVRDWRKRDADGNERDYREFGNEHTDPGDIYRFFVRVKEPVLHQFIEEQVLSSERYRYIREYFPEVTPANYREHARFLQKAEDLYVFNHTTALTQTLYVHEPRQEFWLPFIESEDDTAGFLQKLKSGAPLSLENVDEQAEIYLYLQRQFAQRFAHNGHGDKYQPRVRRIAAVMSAGKNFGVWKTAGREIPWETPAAPNNIIHVRLATGSVVEQMNSHPFGKLHTALTHNGETTNYEALKQRVEQFGLHPLATTDTEVASLKFHLLADELEYPDWALFESFSPTTGDDLALAPEHIRERLEEVQRVEFTSSPDGPYQYLCLRHLPGKRATERVDLKDPADLRPNTTAFWIDRDGDRPRVFSFIASEEQAIQEMLECLDKEGIIRGAAADMVTVTNGMISRFSFDEKCVIRRVDFIDRYGQPIALPDPGEHYSLRQSSLRKPRNGEVLLDALQANRDDLPGWLRAELANWSFATFRWVLKQLCASRTALPADTVIAVLTWLIDHMRGLDTGKKAKSSMLDITRKTLYDFLDTLPKSGDTRWQHCSIARPECPPCSDAAKQVLLIDATGYEPEGTDARISIAPLLAQAYDLGWRRFLLYRVNGQRLISTAVMGTSESDDVEIDVYGIPGEYTGAFMQGGRLRVHGNSQNFTAMGMHHGEIRIYGNAGKVCGYGSKGGDVFILGDIVDRAWTNSVNDSRGQDLRVHIFGTASKYAGESLMGGKFFFAGLYYDAAGAVCIQDRPYRGTKLLGGAGRGQMLFFNPFDRLDPDQYAHGKIEEITAADWPDWQKMIIDTLTFAGVEISEDVSTGERCFTAGGRRFTITPENFTLIVAKGGLKGYESH